MAQLCKVFIVNHEPDIVELLAMAIAQSPGCACEPAIARTDTPITDLFERIQHYHPDLVILDFIPGHTECWDLLAQLRTHPATSAIPVLALSTSEPLAEQTLRSFNVHRIVVKPFDLDQVTQAIQDILNELSDLR